MTEGSEFRKSTGRVLREALGPVAWSYVLLKIAVFDVDTAALRWLAPTFEWLLNYKFFGLLAAMVVLLLVLGPQEFLLLVGFVLAYPFVVLFWKIPKRLYKRWPVILVFLPAIGAAVARMWSTFLLYTLAAFSALFILASSHRWLIVTSVACLAPLLIIHLWRSLRKAYAASLLTQLAGLVSKLRSSIEAGNYVPWGEKPVPVGPTAGGAGAAPAASPLQVAYSFHWLAATIAERVRCHRTSKPGQ